MSTGINRFFLSVFFCDGFSARKRVLKEIRREKEMAERIENGDVPVKPRKVRLSGREWLAYFFIVNVKRNPVVFLFGIPAAIILYLVSIVQLTL